MDPENLQTKNTENLNTQNVVPQQLPNLTQPVSTNPAPNSTAQGDNNSTKIAKNPLQNKRKSTIIVFILVFIISLGTLITSVSTIIKNNKAKSWPTASGVIIKKDRIVKNSSRSASYAYTVDFLVENKQYTFRYTSKNYSIDTGTNVTVAYNITDPNEAVILGESGSSQYNYVILFASMILAPFSIYGIIHNIENKS